MDTDTLNDFISKIIDGNNTEAKDDFENIIAHKLNAALDAKKIEVARSIYGQQEVEDSHEEGEEQEEGPEQESENAVQ